MNRERDWADFFAYLDELRESGVTNMFGASPYPWKICPNLRKR